jgi:predicted nuclease of predicted toxin-antitoxin system
VKIKLDENLSNVLKNTLETEGYDVETVIDEGLGGKNDLEVGNAAKIEERMLFTLDVGFADLRKYPPGTHSGIILFRPQKLGVLNVNNFIINCIRSINLSELIGCVVIVEFNRIRIRRPPEES